MTSGQRLLRHVSRVARFVRRPHELRPALAARRRARADVRAADTALRTWTATAPRDRPVDAMMHVAARLAELRQIDRAVAVLDLADESTGGAAEVLRARRRLPRFIGTVSPHILHAATVAARGSATDSLRATTIPVPEAEPIRKGDSTNLEALVRHHLDAAGATMVRKTIRGRTPREVGLYRSGLLAGGGRWWRQPTLYHVAPDGIDRWHLFLEDLGALERDDDPALVVRAARALGELSGMHGDHESLAVEHTWLGTANRAGLRFARPAWAARRMPGLVDADVVEQVVDTLSALVPDEGRLTRRRSELPCTLAHGDANTGNLTERGETIVLFDWNMVRLAPVGTDLGQLLGRSTPTVHEHPALVDDAIDAFLDGASTAGTTFQRDDVEFGYRSRLVEYSLRQELIRLPNAPSAETAATAAEGTTVVEPETSFRRLCNEARRLLQSLSLGFVTLAPEPAAELASIAAI